MGFIIYLITGLSLCLAQVIYCQNNFYNNTQTDFQTELHPNFQQEFFFDPFSSVKGALWSESPTMQERLLRPEDAFLLNGSTQRRLGKVFLFNPGLETKFIWPNDALNEEGFLFPSNHEAPSKHVLIQLGNEVGDSHLQELKAGSPHNNHTPFSALNGAWTYRAFSAAALFYQNDLHLSTSYPWREALATSENPIDAPEWNWFGENQPNMSTLGFEMTLAHRQSLLGLRYYSGWRWLSSPQSGLEYPFVTRNWQIHVQNGKHSALEIEQEQMKSPLQEPRDYSWTRNAYRFLFSDESHSDQAAYFWNAQIGYQNEWLESSRLFDNATTRSYPLHMDHHIESWDEDSLWIWKAQGSVASQGPSWILQEKIGLERNMSFLTVFPYGMFQYADREAQFRHSQETASLSSPLSSALLPGAELVQNGEFTIPGAPWGAALGFQSRLHNQSWSLNFEASTAAETQTPVFYLDTVHSTQQGLQIREGHYEAMGEFQYHSRLESVLSHSLFSMGTVFIRSGLRHYWNDESQNLEREPSPWWSAVGIDFNFPSELRVTLIVQRIGAKINRSYGSEFSIPEHWENHLFLDQQLAQGVTIRFGTQHFFGREIREEINGSPLRFRATGEFRGQW